ncbi:hypothetical protein D9611_002587 [Ephemerocybe angulata]|uniref:SWIM-type domain-containing protein n=1 Tax=Ephemerocybe angulata TaxID=980116 RepID=A0A8H5C2R6_9AGAR|nr:hypothetical protein D9611_002587 [Tulosesus angulatus]
MLSQTSKFRIDPSITSTAPSVNHAEPQPPSTLEPDLLFHQFDSSVLEEEEEDEGTEKVRMEWPSLEKAKEWMARETEEKLFSFSAKEPRRPNKKGVGKWVTKHIYMCSRGKVCGSSRYVKKHDRDRKVPNKRTGCGCRLTLTVLMDKTVIGLYVPDHNHELGAENARFTRMSSKSRQEIEGMLRMGIDPTRVLEHVRGRIYTEEGNSSASDADVSRSEFISRSDVRRVERIIEEESIRLAKKDGPSVLRWVEKLRSEGHYVFLKTSSDASAATSVRLDSDAFVLIIQTQYQQECWQKHGARFAGIDATHNTTHYEGMNLFTLLVRDRWGHGMPCAWMLSSNATEETISFFMSTMRTRFPDVAPEYVMSDKDHGQINAVRQHYPDAEVLLCWWHVLHNWQQRFNIHAFPELWSALKRWIRITDNAKFWSEWERIQTIAPASVTEYLKTNWIPNVKLWSAVFRKERTIFQDCDTNMLVEAWHHILKGKFMQNKRNRRADHLIYILTQQVIPYFRHKHRAQEHGFEGPDLEVRERIRIERLANTIPSGDIVQSDDDSSIFTVKSQSLPDVHYKVDLDAYDCSCLSFPKIMMCKHIFAAQIHYPELCEPISSSSLNTSSPDTFESNGQSELRAPPEVDEAQELIKKAISSLSSLVCALKDQHSSQITSRTSQLQSLIDTADEFTANILRDAAQLLPKQKKIAPNQHTWPETRDVMNAHVKSKRKRVHTDAYAGGEKSGKKAKADALHALIPGPSSSSTQPPVPPVSAAHTPLAPNINQTPSTYLSGLAVVPPASMIAPQGPTQQPDSQMLPPTQFTQFSQFTQFTQAPAFQDAAFDPSTFNIQDIIALRLLKRQLLNKVAKFHGVSAGGSNEDIIARLQARLYNH